MIERDPVTDFTMDGWTDLVRRLYDEGYRPVSFDAVEANKPHLVLRHDVHFSLDAALAIARAEAELDVRTAYFIMVRSESYNIMEPETAAALNEIRGLGHAIGLHLDASLYPTPKQMEIGADAECRTLAAATDCDIEVLSVHGLELGNGEELPDRIAGRRNLSASFFTRTVGYCSDRDGAWSPTPPLSHPAVRDRKALQLATEPLWWTGDGTERPADRMARFLNGRRQWLDEKARARLAEE